MDRLWAAAAATIQTTTTVVLAAGPRGRTAVAAIYTRCQSRPSTAAAWVVAADGKQAGDKYSAQSVRQGKTTRLEWKVRRLSVFPFFFSCPFFSIPSAYGHSFFFVTKKKLFVVPSKRLCPIAYFPILVVLCNIARSATAFFFCVCVPTRR